MAESIFIKNLRQEKLLRNINILVQTYPNDADLGGEIRKLYNDELKKIGKS